MKAKIQTIFTVLALAGTINAQSINVTPTGVGIGTPTPTQKLDVAGNVAATGNITAGGTLTTGGSVSVGSSLSTVGSLSAGNGVGGPQGNFEIYTYTDANATPLISLRSRYDGAGKYGMIRFGDASQTINYQKGAIIYESTTSVGRGRMHLALENTDGAGSVALSDAKFTVLSNGNVGMGTITPQARLSLAGSPSIDLNDTLNFIQMANNTYSIQTSIDLAALSDTKYGDSNRLYLQPLVGWVGIGTQGLDNFGHKLVVNGTVKSKGFVTDTSTWSDYVFAKDYKLPTLSEVEQHIEANGHLPGIPSEKEVLANGINLGDMQSKLLAQIEQLTLHMIKHEKAIEALKVENAELKSELKAAMPVKY